MQCQCGSEMRLQFVADTGSSPDQHYAYNVYRCGTCDMIAKEDVWRDPQLVIWIATDNTITQEERTDDPRSV